VNSRETPTLILCRYDTSYSSLAAPGEVAVMSTTIGAWVLCMRAPVVLLHWCFGVTLVPRSAKEQHLHRRPPTPRGAHTATYVPACFVGEAEYPEGCVVVFGGHTNNCSESLSTVDVLAIHNWSWTAARWIVGEGSTSSSTWSHRYSGGGGLSRLHCGCWWWAREHPRQARFSRIQ